MSKKIGVFCFIFAAIGAVVFLNVTKITASEPSNPNRFRVQVPHVVLPETIQYKEYTDAKSWPEHNGGVGAARRPAFYTPFPSYSLPEDTEFRVINQLYYPVTPVSQGFVPMETVAQVQENQQIVPTDRQVARNSGVEPSNIPPFETPPMQNLASQANVEPIYLTKINETKNPIQLVSGISDGDSQDDSAEETPQTPVGSIAFLKSQRAAQNDGEDASPLRLRESFVAANTGFSETAFDLFDAAEEFGLSRHVKWLERESLWIRPVSYSEVAPPTQLSLMPLGNGFQQAQPAPAYGQLCHQNYNYGQTQYQQPRFGGLFSSPPPQANYQAATGLNSAWNAYFGAAASQQPAPMQSAQYNSLAQLGGMMPMMAGQGMTMPNSGYGMPMQPQMMQSQMQMSGGGMQQQTIGYILLYPQAAQSGVNMQLAQSTQSDDQNANGEGEPSGEDSDATGQNARNPAMPQMQATFIPASQMPNFPGNQPWQAAMMQPQMNPMMGGMNPYMMNPMMGGMNPYMMNPMMGMGGMMPPIIIQMPAGDTGRRRQGLFGRRRAAREESANRYQQASGSLSSLFTQPERMPAKAAYPYGYFGADSVPYQTGNFGGYHDMRMQVVQYPGM